MSLKVAASAMFLVGALSVAQTAAATTITLGTANTALSGFTGPYVEVTVTLVNSTTADITFQSLVNGGFVYLLTDGQSVALNVNATTFNATSPVGTNIYPGFTPGPYTFDTGNADGFGSFNLLFDSAAAFKNSADKITFTLTNSSGSWSSDTNVLALNGSGYLAAAHVGACPYPSCNDVTGTSTGFSQGSTGFAAGNSYNQQLPPPVPEPGSLVLLGSGLIGAAFGLRRRLKKK